MLAIITAGLLLAVFAPVDAAPPLYTPPSTPAAGTPISNAVPGYRQAQNIAVLTVEGGIDAITLRSLERRMEAAVTDGADAVVLEIDTPGGDMLATLDICHLLKDRTETPANVVAWIRPQAFSAGTYMALACREIVVAPNAVFGDAAPISVGPMGLQPLPVAERAKMESPLLAEVVDSARRHLYDENLVQAFVAVGLELWLVEHLTTGDTIFVTRDEYLFLFGDNPPNQIPSGSPGALNSTITPVLPYINPAIPRPDLSGTPESEIAQEVQNAQTRARIRAPLDESDRGQWRLITQVVTADRLLTVNPAEAMFYGLAVTTIADDLELKQFFGASTIRRYHRSWSETLTRFMISWPVRIVLIIIFILGLFIELTAPGTGLFGAVAAAALLVLIGAPFLAGMAQWWDILLVGIGIALIAAELFVIPGTGLPGLAGAVCLLAGIVGTFITGDLSTPQGQSELWTGVLTTVTGFFGAGIGLWLISRQIHSLPLFDRLILRTELRGSAGGRTEWAPTTDPTAPDSSLPEPGSPGTAASDLRPSGRAMINGRLYDVQSIGSFIEAGAPVRVVRVGFQIEVEEVAG